MKLKLFIYENNIDLFFYLLYNLIAKKDLKLTNERRWKKNEK